MSTEKKDKAAQGASGQGATMNVIKDATQAQGAKTPETGKHLPAVVKPAFNLEKTLDIIEALHKKQMQRARMTITLDNLETFEFKRSEEEAEESNNYYGCALTIEDDERRKFSSKNPIIIKKIVDFAKTIIQERITDLEAEIVIPAA